MKKKVITQQARCRSHVSKVAMNVALKTILDPGDEVLTPIPCFVEYKFYADNHCGVLKTVQTTADFELVSRGKHIRLDGVGHLSGAAFPDAAS